MTTLQNSSFPNSFFLFTFKPFWTPSSNLLCLLKYCSIYHAYYHNAVAYFKTIRLDLTMSSHSPGLCKQNVLACGIISYLLLFHLFYSTFYVSKIWNFGQLVIFSGNTAYLRLKRDLSLIKSLSVLLTNITVFTQPLSWSYS